MRSPSKFCRSVDDSINLIRNSHISSLSISRYSVVSSRTVLIIYVDSLQPDMLVISPLCSMILLQYYLSQSYFVILSFFFISHSVSSVYSICSFLFMLFQFHLFSLCSLRRLFFLDFYPYYFATWSPLSILSHRTSIPIGALYDSPWELIDTLL